MNVNGLHTLLLYRLLHSLSNAGSGKRAASLKYVTINLPQYLLIETSPVVDYFIS